MAPATNCPSLMSVVLTWRNPVIVLVEISLLLPQRLPWGRRETCHAEGLSVSIFSEYLYPDTGTWLKWFLDWCFTLRHISRLSEIQFIEKFLRLGYVFLFFSGEREREGEQERERERDRIFCTNVAFYFNYSEVLKHLPLFKKWHLCSILLGID